MIILDGKKTITLCFMGDGGAAIVDVELYDIKKIGLDAQSIAFLE